jgi:Ca2+-binding RTX toxin-like protein
MGGLVQDLLVTFGGSQTLNGGDGDDVLGTFGATGGTAGASGTDILNGGNGNDGLYLGNVAGLVQYTINLGNSNTGAQKISAGANSSSFTISSIESVWGSAVSDSVTGNGDNNTIFGMDGNDTLYGAGGNDTLNGGSGNDGLYGGAGRDLLIGDSGNDTLDGGAIPDRILYTESNTADYGGATGGVTIDLSGITGDGSLGRGTATGAGVGTDVLKNINQIQGSKFNDKFTGSSAQLYESFQGGGGNDTIDGGSIVNEMSNNRAVYWDATGAVTVTLGGVGEGMATGLGVGTDTLININQAWGSNFNDMLVGSNVTSFKEHFMGGAGNDTINGQGGLDVVRYNGSGTSVNVNLSTGLASDGQGGVDTLINIEEVRGSRFDDVLIGSGASLEIFHGMQGNDTINGAGGIDQVSYYYDSDSNGDGAGVLVNLSTSNIVNGQWMDVTASALAGTALQDNGIDTLLNIEDAVGTIFNDVLVGSSGSNKLEGREGFDLLVGGAGNDTLDGGTGNDSMVGDDGNDNYYVHDVGDVVSETNAATAGGIDTVYSYLTHTSTQTYTLGTNVENGRIVTTTASNMTGNSLSNFLYAGKGNNVINGGTGTDSVSFYEGNNGTGVTASLVTGTATGGSGTDTLISIERLYGTNYADKLTGDTGANYLRGYAGNDILDGGTGIDSMVGDDGNDIYYVRDVGDVVSETNAATAGGIDTVYSYLTHSSTQTYTLGTNVENGRIVATTASNMTGNSLSNTIYAGAGNNLISGGTGTEIDTVSYQYGLLSSATTGVNANLATGAVTGGSGADTLTRIENLIGSSLNDTLVGSAGNNSLNGGSGNDSISGGDGNDTLIGGAGKDTLVGGNGNDIFDFNALSEMGLTSTTWDVISGFVSGQDKIDLSTLDANTATTTNDAFDSLTVGGTFSGSFASAGDLYFDNVARVLYGNTDGDVAAEFAIQITGVTTLATSDFIL